MRQVMNRYIKKHRRLLKIYKKRQEIKENFGIIKVYVSDKSLVFNRIFKKSERK